jgi:molybdenum cofactor guanylyltransferase
MIKADDLQPVSGYILAGGQSRRMGRPKHDIEIGGQTLLDIAVKAISAITVGDVTVVGPPTVERIGLRCIPDIAPAAGPLIGIYTALNDCQSEWAAMLACDMPFVTGGMLRLLASIDRSEYDAVVPRQPDGRPQPLCALYKRDVCLVAAADAITRGKLSVGALLDEIRVREVAPDEWKKADPDGTAFTNLNTPEQLAEAITDLSDRHA